MSSSSVSVTICSIDGRLFDTIIDTTDNIITIKQKFLQQHGISLDGISLYANNTILDPETYSLLVFKVPFNTKIVAVPPANIIPPAVNINRQTSYSISYNSNVSSPVSQRSASSYHSTYDYNVLSMHHPQLSPSPSPQPMMEGVPTLSHSHSTLARYSSVPVGQQYINEPHSATSSIDENIQSKGNFNNTNNVFDEIEKSLSREESKARIASMLSSTHSTSSRPHSGTQHHNNSKTNNKSSITSSVSLSGTQHLHPTMQQQQQQHRAASNRLHQKQKASATAPIKLDRHSLQQLANQFDVDPKQSTTSNTIANQLHNTQALSPNGQINSTNVSLNRQSHSASIVSNTNSPHSTSIRTTYNSGLNTPSSHSHIGYTQHSNNHNQHLKHVNTFISDLNDTLDDVSSDIRLLDVRSLKERNDLESKILKLQSEIQKAETERQSQIESLKQQRSILQEKIRDTELQLQNENQKTRDVIAEIQSDIHQVQQQIDTIHQSLSTIESTRQQEIKKYELLESDLQKQLSNYISRQEYIENDIKDEKRQIVKNVVEMIHGSNIKNDIIAALMNSDNDLSIDNVNHKLLATRLSS